MQDRAISGRSGTGAAGFRTRARAALLAATSGAACPPYEDATPAPIAALFGASASAAARASSCQTPAGSIREVGRGPRADAQPPPALSSRARPRATRRSALSRPRARRQGERPTLDKRARTGAALDRAAFSSAPTRSIPRMRRGAPTASSPLRLRSASHTPSARRRKCRCDYSDGDPRAHPSLQSVAACGERRPWSSAPGLAISQRLETPSQHA